MWKNPAREAQAAPAAAPVTQAVPPPAPPPPPPAASTAAASLPPISAAAPPAAAPAATAPAAPTRRPRGRPAAAAQPAAPAPVAPVTFAPPAAAPAPAPVAYAQPAAPAPVQQQAVVSIPAQGFLGVFAPRANAVSSLAKLASIASETGGQPNAFPTMELANNGNFLADVMNREGESDDLPIGNAAVMGVIIGFRHKLIMWPKKQERSSQGRPKWDGVIGQYEGDLTELFIRAWKNYQMGDRSKREMVFDPLGHIGGLLEILLYEEQAGLMVIQSHSSYDSTLQSSVALEKVFPNGLVQPTPVRIHFHAEQRIGSAGVAWNEYILDLQQHMCAETMTAMEGFTQFMQANMNDPALIEAATNWSKTTLTPEQIAVLQHIASAQAR